MLGQFAIGGQLAAEDGQQRRLTVFIVNIQGIVAGNGLRRIRLVVAQRTDAGVGPDDIVPAEGLFKVRVIDVQQGNDSNLLIVFYVQIMPDDFVMQLHRF